MAGVSALLQSVTSQWRKQNKPSTSRQKTSSLRRSVRASRRKRADSEEDSFSTSSDTQQLEVIAPRLSDLQFKYNWDIKHFVDKVRESEEGLNSRPFTIAVEGLTTLWSLSVRCWTQEGGVKLHNPVVICLNLLKVSSSRFSGDNASINFQFGVYNNNLKHFTMGKLEKAKIALNSTDKLKSVGYQNVYLGEANMDSVSGQVRLGMRLSLTVEDNHETCRSGLGRLIDDEKTSDVTITCKDRVFKVHKNILSAQSDVMSQLLTSDPGDSECKASVTSESYTVTDDEAEDLRKTSVMSEAYIVSDDENEEIDSSTVSKNSSGVSIDKLANFRKKSRQNITMLDVDQEVCLKFLDFLYTGQYGLNDEDTLESLLCLSHEYQVAELKNLCAESLVENMQATNVANYLYLSHLHGCSRLKSAALDFCRLNHQNIIKDSQWKKIEAEVPSLYLEAVTSLETPEPCRDHLRCIRESGTRYKAEITKIKS